MQTPWGNAQNLETICSGLDFVDTAGHGGIKVSKELNKNIPSWIKEETHNRLGLEGWYEEDCDWCIPVIVFSVVFFAWAKEEGSEAYIASARKRFKDLFLPDLCKKELWSAELAAFCEKHGIDC